MTAEMFRATSVECPTCCAWIGWACEGESYGYHAAGYHSEREELAAQLNGPCGIPAQTLPPCDLPWGHDGHMHANCGDGFYAAEYDAGHTTRQRTREAATKHEKEKENRERK